MVFKRVGVILALLVLGACGAPKPQGDLRPGTELATRADPAPGAGVYRIDPTQSTLRLLVYRAGAMARLGHNHVIVNRVLGGWVKYPGTVAGSSFVLRFPVEAFAVDDAALRAEEGPDFSAEVPDEAKAGTRRNMLGEALLNAAQFPSITLSSVRITEAGRTGPSGGAAKTALPLTATLAVTVAGHDSTLVVPFVLDQTDGRLNASGSVALRQSELGLTPFSVMLGALQVQDEFTVKFDLVAVAT